MKKNYIFVAFVFLFSSVCESSYSNKTTCKLVSELSEKGLPGALRGNNKKGDGQAGSLNFDRALRSSRVKHVSFADTKKPDKSAVDGSSRKEILEWLSAVGLKLNEELREKRLSEALDNSKKELEKDKSVDSSKTLPDNSTQYSAKNNDEFYLEAIGYSGESIVIWNNSEYIKPGSNAAKAIEKDLKKEGVRAVSLIHGCPQK